MLKLIFACLWYLLPAAVGNHNASCGNRLPLPEVLKKPLEKLAVPIDSGKTLNGREIFGKNKTWRGLVVGVITGILVAGIQARFFFKSDFLRKKNLIDYCRFIFILIWALCASSSFAQTAGISGRESIHFFLSSSGKGMNSIPLDFQSFMILLTQIGTTSFECRTSMSLPACVNIFWTSGGN